MYCFYFSQSSLPYHTSAILATALETITLPLRRKSGSSPTLQDYEHSLVYSGRKGLSVSCAFPLLCDGKPSCLEILIRPSQILNSASSCGTDDEIKSTRLL